jgi:hypothetical protein
MSPRNIIREVAKIIGTLHKGSHPESLAERIKPFSPQCAEGLPVILEIILGGRSRSLSGTEGVEDLQVG